MLVKKGEKVYLEFQAYEDISLYDKNILSELFLERVNIDKLDIVSITPEKNIKKVFIQKYKEELTEKLLYNGLLDTRLLEDTFCNGGGLRQYDKEEVVDE